jgi:hypothetical protein
MDKRKAKRTASGLAAGLLVQHGEQLARTFGTPNDRDRVRASFVELTAELHARAGRDHTPVRNPCCGDTGYADYAAVPCPNPTCTAVTRVMIAAGMSVSETDRHRLENEEAGR